MSDSNLPVAHGYHGNRKHYCAAKNIHGDIYFLKFYKMADETCRNTQFYFCEWVLLAVPFIH